MHVSNMIKKNFSNKPEVIIGVMDIIDKKEVIKDKNNVMKELKLYHEQLDNFGRKLAHSSCESLHGK